MIDGRLSLANMIESIGLVFHLHTLLFIVAGVCIGVVIGALPGLGPALAISVFLPFTFSVPPIESISFLFGLYVAGIYGGSISAILIHTPGTPAAAATVLDGYPLAQKGFANKALKLALYSSVFGTFFGVIVLIVLAPQIAKIALNFGPVEYTALMVFSLSIVGISSGKHILKGLITACFGLALSVVGADPITGASRFSFGLVELMAGFNVVPILIGLFAVSEVLIQLEKITENIKGNIANLETARFRYSNNKKDDLTLKEFFSYWKTLIRSSAIGTFLGSLPAIGATVGCFVAYNEARRTSKEPDKFGTGHPEGVIASESANNATCGAALIPLLTFGVPGDIVTAVLLGALMIQGLRPGPLLFNEHRDLITGLFVSFLVCSLVLLIVARFGLKYFTKVLALKPSFLYPTVLILSLVGSYGINTSIFDLIVTLTFGVIGYLLRKFEYPLAPLIIAFILGPIFEFSLRQSLVFSNTGLLVFLTSPIACLLYILTVVAVVKTIQIQRQMVKQSLSKLEF